MNIRDSVIVVTGGASGLGEACVRHLAEQEAKVCIMDVNVERGEKISSELRDSVIFCRTDVTDEKSVQLGIDKVLETFGAMHVDINCAGIGVAEKVLSKKGPMSIENFNKVVELNMTGTMNMIRLTAEKMIDNTPNEDGEKGVVINTASGAAFEGQIGQAAYSASKAGVVGMTLPIAREFAEYGMRVVTIAPGLFKTPLLNLLPEEILDSLEKTIPFPKRFGKPSEFAMLAAHIIENPMLNGETIRLDGAVRLMAR